MLSKEIRDDFIKQNIATAFKKTKKAVAALLTKEKLELCEQDITCSKYTLYLSPAEVEIKTIAGKKEVMGWMVSQICDSDVHEIKETVSLDEAIYHFVLALFKSKAKDFAEQLETEEYAKQENLWEYLGF